MKKRKKYENNLLDLQRTLDKIKINNFFVKGQREIEKAKIAKITKKIIKLMNMPVYTKNRKKYTIITQKDIRTFLIQNLNLNKYCRNYKIPIIIAEIEKKIKLNKNPIKTKNSEKFEIDVIQNNSTENLELWKFVQKMDISDNKKRKIYKRYEKTASKKAKITKKDIEKLAIAYMKYIEKQKKEQKIQEYKENQRYLRINKNVWVSISDMEKKQIAQY